MAYKAKLVEILILLRVLSVSAGETNNFTLIGSCSSPLGMEEGRIPDSAITASSSYEPKSVGPQHARVRQEKSGGAWCPKLQISSKVREYLEIDLNEPHLITYTETQGRFGNGQGQEYVEQFAIEYWRELLKNWVVYKNHTGHKLLSGNENTYTGVKQKLELPFVANKIRFVPFSEHPRTVCMRVEIYGCPWRQKLVAYTMPRADTEFEDVSYDGVVDDRSMTDGLGQLVDGVLGDEDFISHNDRSNKKWVGWMNDGKASTPLEIQFEFVDYSQISAIFLHTSHFKTREVQIFSKAEVETSLDGVRYYQTLVKKIKPDPDRLQSGTHNVTIYVDVKIAKFVKLKLFFSSRWILISEIQFSSRSVDANRIEELLLKYSESVVNGVQPHQSADDAKDHSGKSSKIDFIETDVYVLVLSVLAVLVVISGLVMMAFVVKKNRQTKLMRKHTALPVNTTFPRVPIALKELEITTPIMSTLAASRCRTLTAGACVGVPPHSQHAKSTGNIYSDIGGPKNGESEDSDASSLYHEPYRRIGVPTYSAHTSRIESRKNAAEYSSTTNFNDDRKYSSISLYNLPTQFPPIVPRTPISYTSVHSPPVTFGGASVSAAAADSRENYYAAADIVQEDSGEQHFTLGKFTTLKLPVDSPDEMYDCGVDSKPALLEFSRHRLRVIEKLGEGSFGMVHLCETEFSCDTYGHTMYLKKQVIVKSMRRGISEETRMEFFRECNQLASIRDANISKVIGICSKDDPVSALQEYLEFGDLPKFIRLQIESDDENTNPILNINFLLYLAAQIASAMKYLESRNIVHRDLAARNCMVGRNYAVKVSDHAIYCTQYENDYYVTDRRSRLPVRWMAWESVLMGNHSSKSDVWSFAVTLWEILMLCEQRPFAECTDEQVIENCSNYYQANERIRQLEWPTSCPKDIYELMKECWRRDNIERPSFTEIQFFLKRKTVGYAPTPPPPPPPIVL